MKLVVIEMVTWAGLIMGPFMWLDAQVRDERRSDLGLLLRGVTIQKTLVGLFKSYPSTLRGLLGLRPDAPSWAFPSFRRSILFTTAALIGVSMLNADFWKLVETGIDDGFFASSAKWFEIKNWMILIISVYSINIVIDYISVYQTSIILYFVNSLSLKKSILLSACDVAITIVIASLCAYLAVSVYQILDQYFQGPTGMSRYALWATGGSGYGISFHDLPESESMIGHAKQEKITISNIFEFLLVPFKLIVSLFEISSVKVARHASFFTTMLTAIWSILYIIGGLLVAVLVRIEPIREGLDYLFDLEKRPFTVIGFSCVSVFWILYILKILFIFLLFRN
jgi:hypothetical protein